MARRTLTVIIAAAIAGGLAVALGGYHFGHGALPPPAAPVERPFESKDIVAGQGEAAARGKTLTIHYTGRVLDGAVFDSTRQRQPLQFRLGLDRVLKGWERGIEGMKVGGKRRLIIPPSLGFGDKRPAGVGPNATLDFEIELLAVR